MKQNASNVELTDPASVVQKSRVTLERLSADAERLKRISELNSLKAARVELSVDTSELLESTRRQQASAGGFATLDEMLLLLHLMAAQTSSDEIAPAAL